MKTETKNEIVKAITEFIEGADESNLERLDTVLHSAFRNVQYGFFEQTGVFTINRAKYIALVGEKKFGGVERTMDLLSLEVLPNIAMATVKLESVQLTFHSFISLVCEDGVWKVIENFPHVTLKS
ncbi:nuclear transport factor 2 family protein [Fulvivirgaceae bacterium BMA12]|uniref:Nuclear transport factor 2 family protein n=1 Tax=Agaribacillus aureus TaxID=3051825 RepID=A0ABT8L2F1_9BACT|nr:nuclear transport factor 2 family protein [Fulvivirgaceae bacterium BMA12]